VILRFVGAPAPPPPPEGGGGGLFAEASETATRARTRASAAKTVRRDIGAPPRRALKRVTRRYEHQADTDFAAAAARTASVISRAAARSVRPRARVTATACRVRPSAERGCGEVLTKTGSCRGEKSELVRVRTGCCLKRNEFRLLAPVLLSLPALATCFGVHASSTRPPSTFAGAQARRSLRLRARIRPREVRARVRLRSARRPRARVLSLPRNRLSRLQQQPPFDSGRRDSKRGPGAGCPVINFRPAGEPYSRHRSPIGAL
jgi:hypothetical protein